VVQVYESDDLASKSDDEKRLRKAKNSADKKRKDFVESKPGSSKHLTVIISFFEVIIFPFSVLLCCFS